MASSEAVLQVLSGTAPHNLVTNVASGKFEKLFSPSYQLKCAKRRVPRYTQLLSCSSMLHSNVGAYGFQGIGRSLFGLSNIDRLCLQSCKCQHPESRNGVTAEDVNGTWYIDSSKKFNPVNGTTDAPNALEFQDVQHSKQEKEIMTSSANGTIRDAFDNISIDSIEDEAWDLLRESMVYYCGSPIGTIAAKDLTNSNMLNYDHVFIRDFIPSGIAFLLKGEYDIVRNFILHTLQLQVG